MGTKPKRISIQVQEDNQSHCYVRIINIHIT
jgi:hypothetical protein